ncbi:beta-lactamase family protein [Flavobacteriaceae bacterium S0825]|uniref:serine hydrolase domain-containing protein n=1 Tax=Gaetbulibacter sp. S0825 TaxID=2720084 RepID=UPI0014310F79|nr:serine hydrolase domain-containing protein [Gaetbulibacter sp. S0825]MCK0109909.1 beta-lactamase family protein [Flavobacteriaceae bacterium S0825]NIX65538.1 beta-lactamase family protein [Gaetbulibacter sp. S0825]
MKHLKHLLCYIVIITVITSCNSNTSTEIETSTTTSFSNSYKAPAFENDNRVEKIKQVAPEIETVMIEHAKGRHIPGIAYGIVVDDQLVIASADGVLDVDTKNPSTTTSAFRIASMTKSFTAMAIIKLRDEGKLALNDPVSKYISEMSNLEYLTKDSPIISINNLLTMTAGFPEDNPWGDRQLDEPNDMLISMIDEGVTFSNAPSFEFEYSNTGYALLGNIVSRVSGEPYQEYIKNNILQPLGMNNTYWEWNDVPKEELAIGYRWEDEQWKLEPMLHDGSFGSMGGLITTIEDFSKYVSFHLSAWPPRSDSDNGPIKRSSLREMQTPQFPRLYPNARDYNGDTCALMNGYGFGLGIATYCNDIKRVSHGGALPGFGSNYYFYPEYGVGVMAFGNLTYTGPLPISKVEQLLFDKAGLEPRELPVSDILEKRKEQVLDLVQNWDANLEKEIIAENFYLDRSREKRMSQAKQIFAEAGAIVKVEDLTPLNQLRGRFNVQTENGIISMFFTLTPEKSPKVQRLNISFKETLSD